jgi:hypothetical protein
MLDDVGLGSERDAKFPDGDFCSCAKHSNESGGNETVLSVNAALMKPSRHQLETSYTHHAQSNS